MNIKNALLTAAVGGILAGVTGCGGGATPAPKTPSGSDATPATAPAKHSCTGMKSGDSDMGGADKSGDTSGGDTSGGSDTGGGADSSGGGN